MLSYLLIIIAILVSTVVLKADDFKSGEYLIKDDQIVCLQNNLPLVIVYDDGRSENISNQNSLERVSDYSALAPIIKRSFERILQQVENNIQSLEKNLQNQFDDAYLEMATACLMADAGYANNKIAEILTEERTFSLEETSNNCKEYHYYEELKIVLDQSKFYEKFLEFADDEISKRTRNAEREIRWSEATPSADSNDTIQAHKSIDDQKIIIQQCEEDRSYLPEIKAVIDDTKVEVESLEKQYHRVYKKTNDTFLLYSNLLNKVTNKVSMHGQLPAVRALADGWATTLLQESTLNAISDVELAEKELYSRRNPAPALNSVARKVSINSIEKARPVNTYPPTTNGNPNTNTRTINRDSHDNVKLISDKLKGKTPIAIFIGVSLVFVFVIGAIVKNA